MKQRNPLSCANFSTDGNRSLQYMLELISIACNKAGSNLCFIALLGVKMLFTTLQGQCILGTRNKLPLSFGFPGIGCKPTIRAISSMPLSSFGLKLHQFYTLLQKIWCQSKNRKRVDNFFHYADWNGGMSSRPTAEQMHYFIHFKSNSNLEVS